jgi:hypothetical protein
MTIMQKPDINEVGATRRSKWRTWTRVLAAGAVVAAAGATGSLLMASASDAPSALAVVTSAIQKTSADSYSFNLDSTMRFGGREWHSDVVSGSFDPRHELGAESLIGHGQNPAKAQIRFIGKYVYTLVSPGSSLGTMSKPWDKAPVPSASTDGMAGDGSYGFISDQPVSPAELSGVLRSAGTVRDEGPASGLGWTGTRYTFTARFPGERESVTGTVYVDQQERIRRLVTTTTEGKLTMSRDLTFGDFGASVPVTTPAVTQVDYTSTPYWGFLF